MAAWCLKLAVGAATLQLGGGSGYTAAGTNHKTSPHGDNLLPYIFQHVGKAGGGTIGERIKAYGLVDWFSVCHPGPCLTAAVASSHEGMLLNVRDPVDRFVSGQSGGAAAARSRYHPPTTTLPPHHHATTPRHHATPPHHATLPPAHHHPQRSTGGT